MRDFKQIVKSILGQGRTDRKLGSPPGLGGYRLNAIGTAFLDPRQEPARGNAGAVTVFYAELIDRNKYSPRRCRDEGKR